MATNQCAHRTCRNPIRSGQTYCYRHGGLTAAELDSGGGRKPGSVTVGELHEVRERRKAAKGSAEWALASSPPMPLTALTPLDSVAQAYTHHLPLSVDTAEAVLYASRDVLGKYAVEAPMDAAQQRGKIREVAQRLGEQIGHDRVTVVQMRGLVRKTAARPRMVSPNVTHEVLILDRGTDSEVLVDPFIAAFAPVSREAASRPVVNSGMKGAMVSPYVDAPWIGNPEEYRLNGFMEWQGASLTH